jgi:ABC-2 type transport system ATP-binding protein
MIHIEQVNHAFGQVQALQSVNIEVPRGELFGLIGPDGAGKTTLFRILATLLIPDSGSAHVDGLDVVRDYKAIRHKIGYMPGRFALYQDLSIIENLTFFASVFGTSIAENYEQIKPIYSQIEPYKDRRAGQLSGGMKQKLALCCALVHQPDLLLLDEPTTGVDPVSRKEFWEILQQLRQQGLTIMVSTPYMDEAALCDRIAFIQQGVILDEATPTDMVARHRTPLWQLRGPNMFPLLQMARQWSGTESCYAFGDSHHLTPKPNAQIIDFHNFMKSNGFSNIEVFTIEPSIEDTFMQLL